MLPMSNEITVRDGYGLFWGQWPSNWEMSPFVLDGVTYNCVEQYMMQKKALCFGDTATADKIMATADPHDQKRYGREVNGYVDAKWAAVRYDIVLRAVIEKYRQNPDLRAKLMATGNLIMVEASPKDVVWGIGLGARDPDATRPEKWRGTNLLGKATTEAREILRAEAER